MSRGRAGVAREPALNELYRLGWDVKDLAYDVARSCRPHADGENGAKTRAGPQVIIRQAG